MRSWLRFPSGAPQWADRLRNDTGGDGDQWTPSTWRTAWEWAGGEVTCVRSAIETLRALSGARVEAETEQRRLFAEVVRLRTFLGMKILSPSGCRRRSRGSPLLSRGWVEELARLLDDIAASFATLHSKRLKPYLVGFSRMAGC